MALRTRLQFEKAGYEPEDCPIASEAVLSSMHGSGRGCPLEAVNQIDSGPMAFS